MKIGYILLCRYNSVRLPGKILKKINQKPVIQYIIERLLKVGKKENVIVCTSKYSSDNPIIEYCKKNEIAYYRGALNNVAKRFVGCAKENHFDYSVRINGDNIFVDIQTLNKMVKIAKDGKFDFISNVKERTFPKGMSIEIIRTSFYYNLFLNFNKEAYYEHVTLPLYEDNIEGNFYFEYNKICPEAAGIHLAIDTLKDFKLVQKIIQYFEEDHTKYNLKRIFNIYRTITEEKL